MIFRGYRLMWEEWRRTRTATLVVVLILAALSVLVWSLDDRRNGVAAAIWSFLSIYGLIIYLILSQSTRSNVGMSVPSRRFRLPITSFELAFWPFLYRLAVVSVAAAFAATINRLVAPDFTVVTPFFTFCLILSALHTLAYVSPLLNRWIIGVLLFVLLWPAPALIGHYYGGPDWRYPVTDFACIGLAVAATLAITTAAMRKVRSGGWGLVGATRSRRISAPAAASYVKPMRSPAAAQRWFEWQSSSKSIVLLMAVVSLAVVVSEAASNTGYSESKPTIDASLAIMILLTNSAIVGLWAFANRTAKTQRDSSTFIQTRPVSDFQIARGKLETSLMTILINLVIVSAIVLLINVVIGLVKYESEWAQVFDIKWHWKYMLLLPASIGLSWIVYWRGPFMAAVSIPVSIWANNWPRHFEKWVYADGVIRPETIAVIIAATCLLLIPFARAFCKRLLPLGGLIVSATVGAGLTALTAACFIRYAMPDFDTLGASSLSAMLAVLALSPFAIVPLKVARARHL